VNVKHYLLTRFDYPVDYPYLEDRIDLFFGLTMPSVFAQESRDFTWIVQSSNPQVCRLIPENYSFLRVQPRFDLPGDSEWVITTRLDNDDFVSPSFIADIRRAAEPATCVLDAPGYRYCHRTKRVVLRDYHHPQNPSPFISLVERREKMRGVYCHWHNKMGEHFPVRLLSGRNWVQTIHAHNKLMQWEKIDNREVEPPQWFPRMAK
jgi:hypothetical protein